MDRLVSQLRTIASKGRMDDADVQVVFDAADRIVELEAELDRLNDLIGDMTF